jgi:hypothetical protein
VPSSTSSSSTAASRLALPARAPLAALAIAVALCGVLVVGLEWRLASRGIVPTAIDSEALWLQERARASRLGADALVLVGASRMQLDVDLGVLRRRSGLEPVQLAIDGSGILPVLEGLARDPAITGMVLVDIDDASLAAPRTDSADRHQALFEQRPPLAPWTYHAVEERLSRALRRHLRAYADGARPVTSLLQRAVRAPETGQYLFTLPDRSRLADYRKVPMPRAYLERVAVELGLPSSAAAGDAALVTRRFTAQVDALVPADNAHYLRNVERVRAAIATIEGRGGHVRLVVFPTSGLVAAAGAARFPRTHFWDRMAAMAGPRALHSADRPALAAFRCPDGSHLDMRDRARFTGALADELGMRGR